MIKRPIRITVEEFQNNIDYYLEKSKEEEVLIVQDDMPISLLINPETHQEYIRLKNGLKY